MLTDFSPSFKSCPGLKLNKGRLTTGQTGSGFDPAELTLLSIHFTETILVVPWVFGNVIL